MKQLPSILEIQKRIVTNAHRYFDIFKNPQPIEVINRAHAKTLKKLGANIMDTIMELHEQEMIYLILTPTDRKFAYPHYIKTYFDLHPGDQVDVEYGLNAALRIAKGMEVKRQQEMLWYERYCKIRMQIDIYYRTRLEKEGRYFITPKALRD